MSGVITLLDWPPGLPLAAAYLRVVAPGVVAVTIHPDAAEVLGLGDFPMVGWYSGVEAMDAAQAFVGAINEQWLSAVRDSHFEGERSGP